MSTVRKTLNTKNGKININAVFNKKFKQAILFIDFKTSQKRLLSALLYKYATEKSLNTGVSMVNGIISAIPGETSIVLVVPDNKVTNNIVLLRAYLGKAKLSAAAQKHVGKGDYDKLLKDIDSFDVIVTGACRTFCKALDANEKKIDNLISNLNTIKDSDRDSFDYPVNNYCSVDFSGNATAQLYASICLGDIPCNISRDKIEFLTPDGCELLRTRLMYKDTFQGLVKQFLRQTGACGTPAANDNGGKKYKEKCDYILHCEATLSEIYSRLRGFEYKFMNVSQLNAVDSDAMSAVKQIKLPKCSCMTCGCGAK